VVVEIEKREDGELVVAMAGGAGGGMGAASCVRVRPDEWWRGWKYSRLERLAGRGKVDLQTKDQRRAADGVSIGGERPE
jgi:hypothetical protein